MILEEFVQARASFANPSPELYAAFTGDWPPRTASGESINPRTALGISAYFGAMRAISEDVAKIPCPAYRRLPRRGKEREPSLAVHRIFNVEPNPDMTPMTWRSLTLQHAMGWGNGFSVIEFEPGSTEIPRYVWPVDPSKVTIRRDKNRLLEYQIQVGDGVVLTVPAWQMFHVHGMGGDGLSGYSIARMARETLGLAMAEEKSGAALFGRGSRPGGILMLARELTKEAHAAFRERWEDQYGGANRNWTTAILGPGMDYKTISQPNKDAQWIESRGFGVVEVCRWFRMPPNKLAHLDKASYNNIAEENISYVGDTLTPWMTYVEQEAIRKLIPTRQRQAFFVEHLVAGLLRGDIEKRYNAYSTARQWGWMSADDVRELENQNPLPNGEGEIYLVPMNMTTPQGLLDAQDQQNEPPPEPPREQQPIQNSVRGIVEGLAPILRDAYAQIARIEEDRLTKARKRAKNGETFDSQAFYDRHFEANRSILSGVVRAAADSAKRAIRGDPLLAGEERVLNVHLACMTRRYADNQQRGDEKTPITQFLDEECEGLIACIEWILREYRNGERNREADN